VARPCAGRWQHPFQHNRPQRQATGGCADKNASGRGRPAYSAKLVPFLTVTHTDTNLGRAQSCDATPRGPHSPTEDHMFRLHQGPLGPLVAHRHFGVHTPMKPPQCCPIPLNQQDKFGKLQLQQLMHLPPAADAEPEPEEAIADPANMPVPRIATWSTTKRVVLAKPISLSSERIDQLLVKESQPNGSLQSKRDCNTTNNTLSPAPAHGPW